MKLDRFFERWVRGSGRPKLLITWRNNEAGGAVIRVEQTGEVFDLPLTVQILFADGRSETRTLKLTGQAYEEKVAGAAAIRRVDSQGRTLPVRDRQIDGRRRGNAESPYSCRVVPQGRSAGILRRGPRHRIVAAFIAFPLLGGAPVVRVAPILLFAFLLTLLFARPWTWSGAQWRTGWRLGAVRRGRQMGGDRCRLDGVLVRPDPFPLRRASTPSTSRSTTTGQTCRRCSAGRSTSSRPTIPCAPTAATSPCTPTG